MAPLVEEPAKALGLLVIYAFAPAVMKRGPFRRGVGRDDRGLYSYQDILYIVGAAEEAGGAGFIGVFIRTIMLGMGHTTFGIHWLGFGCLPR